MAQNWLRKRRKHSYLFDVEYLTLHFVGLSRHSTFFKSYLLSVLILVIFLSEQMNAKHFLVGCVRELRWKTGKNDLER